MSDMTPVQLNNLSYDFTRLRVSGFPGTTGSLLKRMIKKINFSDSVTVTVPKGVHGIPLPSGLGTYSAQASLTVQYEAWEQLLSGDGSGAGGGGFSQLVGPGGGYTALQFNLTIDFRNKNNPRPSKYELREVRITGVGDAYSEGDASGLVVDLTLYVRYILRNGVCLYPLDLDSV
jgi:hypothetical protein